MAEQIKLTQMECSPILSDATKQGKTLELFAASISFAPN
jgi:hypothetical protein